MDQKRADEISDAAVGETGRIINDLAEKGQDAVVEGLSRIWGFTKKQAKRLWEGSNGVTDLASKVEKEHDRMQSEKSGEGSSFASSNEENLDRNRNRTQAKNYDENSGGPKSAPKAASSENESMTGPDETAGETKEQTFTHTGGEIKQMESQDREVEPASKDTLLQYPTDEMAGEGQSDAIREGYVSQAKSDLQKDPEISEMLSSSEGWNSSDTEALKAWQRKYGEPYGIEPTGKLDKRTSAVLRDGGWKNKSFTEGE